MKKIISLSAVLLLITSVHAQAFIGISVIKDETSNTDKAFALYEIFNNRKYSSSTEELTPKLVDFVYGTKLGIDGNFSKYSCFLNIYQEGKKVASIQTENKWKLILAQLDAELKLLGYLPKNTGISVDEGKEVKVYEKKMKNNLPGNITIDAPQNFYSDKLKIKAGFDFFKPKDIYEELKELHGNYGSADITESKFFKQKDIPQQVKDAVKPLASPISNTVILPVTYLFYGNALLQKEDYEAAQHCYLQAIQGSNELLASSKDKAAIRQFAYEKLAFLQTKLQGTRKLMEEMYTAAANLNKSAMNSAIIMEENKNYYNNVVQIQNLCEKAEENAKAAKGARLSMIMGAVNRGIGQAGMSLGQGQDLSQLTQAMQVTDLAMVRSQEQINISESFKTELRDAAINIQSDIFKTDAGGLQTNASGLANEVLYYLSLYPAEVQEAIEEFAVDKPVLQKSITDFYTTQDKKEKQKALKQVYKHLAKMEAVVANFEVRGIAVSDKYKSEF